MATKNGPAVLNEPVVLVGVTEALPDVRALKIPQIEIGEAILTCRGMSPLITHKWSEKAVRQLVGSQTGRAKEQKAPKDPEQEWKDACYVAPGREDWEDGKPGKYCLPASAFKHAFLYGVGQLDDTKGMPKTKATGYVFVASDPIIDFESLSVREDITRNPTQVVYRPQFENWSCDLEINYNARTITLEQIVALFDLGGFAGGIGEWRPSAPKNKSGSFGRFRVSSVRSI